MSSETTKEPAIEAEASKVLSFYELSQQTNPWAKAERNRIPKILIKMPQFRDFLQNYRSEALRKIAERPIPHYIAEPNAISPMTLLSGRNGAEQHPLFVAKGDDEQPMITIMCDTSSSAERIRVQGLMETMAKHAELFEELAKPVDAAQICVDAEDLMRFLAENAAMNYGPLFGFMYPKSIVFGHYYEARRLQARKLAGSGWLKEKLKSLGVEVNAENVRAPDIKTILTTPIQMGWIFPVKQQEVKPVEKPSSESVDINTKSTQELKDIMDKAIAGTIRGDLGWIQATEGNTVQAPTF